MGLDDVLIVLEDVWVEHGFALMRTLRARQSRIPWSVLCFVICSHSTKQVLAMMFNGWRFDISTDLRGKVPLQAYDLDSRNQDFA